MERRFNEPLYNQVLGITNDIVQPCQSYSKLYVKILDKTNLNRTKPHYDEHNPGAQRKIFPDITKKCQCDK